MESDFRLSSEYVLAFFTALDLLLSRTTPASLASASALASRSARFFLIPRAIGSGTFCRFISLPVSSLYCVCLCLRACFPAKAVEPRAWTSRIASSKSTSADEYVLPLLSRSGPLDDRSLPRCVGADRGGGLLPTMDVKSGNAEGQTTTLTAFRCLFFPAHELALAAPAADNFLSGDDDDLAIAVVGGQERGYVNVFILLRST
mmetsp:Transcript_14511/g.32346  ORF Transcript_14511/g.32346 Transcript_14511/m.32346 type:complete len:203 (-) Transcript_14511:21-629(-)